MHKFLVKVVSFSLQSKLGATSVCEFILHTVCLRGEGGGGRGMAKAPTPKPAGQKAI